MTRRLLLIVRRVAAVGSAAIAAAVVAVLVASLTTEAAGPAPGAVDAGDLTVVSPANRDRPIASGASATPFTLQPPDDATCPGDSANDNWRIQGFMVPAGDDPADIVFTVNDPEGEGQWALYGVDTRPYVDQLLLQNDVPGRPGLLDEVPPLSFGVFLPGLIEPGDYRLGLGCTFVPRQLDRYWDVVVTIADDPQDTPAGFRWTVSAPDADAAVRTASADAAGFGRWTTVAGVTAGAAAVAVALQLLKLRRASAGAPTTSAEPAPKETS